MTEVIGDIVMPSAFVAPRLVTTALPAAPQTGTVFYDSTTNKLKVWTGSAYETISSAA